MSTTLPVFTPIEETLYLTLCGRALDNHLAQPILGDTMAEQVVSTLGYDCGRFRLSASPILNIALRGEQRVGDLGGGREPRPDQIDPPAVRRQPAAGELVELGQWRLRDGPGTGGCGACAGGSRACRARAAVAGAPTGHQRRQHDGEQHHPRPAYRCGWSSRSFPAVHGALLG